MALLYVSITGIIEQKDKEEEGLLIARMVIKSYEELGYSMKETYCQV